MSDDPYKVLGISPSAGDDEIRAAYLAGAKRLHPDAVGESESGERMRELNLAYEILRDPETKARYDYESRRTGGLPADLEAVVAIWSEEDRMNDMAHEKMAALNREMAAMQHEGWDVRRHHDHLVCTRTERKGLFSRPVKRRVTVNIDRNGVPFHVEQKRPD